MQLFLLFTACLAACWFLSRYNPPRSSIISGVVVDWKTGQPAAGAEVREHEANSSRIVARTDERGRFTFERSDSPSVYFLFAGAPRYGKLLQTTFGQTVVLYRKGERANDVVIPAIPSTKLSGHVYGSDGMPLSGCSIAALTRRFALDSSTNLQGDGSHAMQAFEFEEADDPRKLMEVSLKQTDRSGKFLFDDLGADRYILLARCQNLQKPGTANHSVWAPMLYPDAISIDSAKEVVVLPGESRGDIDFHLHRQRTYSLEGKIIFSDHSGPKPGTFYAQDLRVVRSDRAFTSTWLGQEDCQINSYAGTFKCDSLLAGEYTFYFEVLEDGRAATKNAPVQAAKARYKVPAPTPRPPLVVELKDLSDGGVRYMTPFARPSGTIDLARECDMGVDGKPAIIVLVWGHGHAGGACYFMTFEGNTKLILPKDHYYVNAFEASFLSEKHYPDYSSKVEAALMQHATSMNVDLGQTVEPSLPIVSTKELINIAFKAVRDGP